MNVNVIAMAKAEKAKQAAANNQTPALPCPKLKVNDGTEIPIFGLGCYRSEPGAEAYESVKMALAHGYRLIDTAELYANEGDVGRAIRDSGIPRDQIHITTKFWAGNGHGHERVMASFAKSLRLLGVEYVDLYLIHSPGAVQGRMDTWRAFEKLKAEGKARSIGVSNYGTHHLKTLLQECSVRPAVNQIELSPFLTRTDITSYCAQEGIVVEAYSPLTKGKRLSHPTLVEIARKYNKSAAQLLIRWCIEHKYVVIPKSVKESRIIENSQVFDFTIDPADVATLDGLDEYLTTGWDPTKDP